MKSFKNSLLLFQNHMEWLGKWNSGVKKSSLFHIPIRNISFYVSFPIWFSNENFSPVVWKFHCQWNFQF